MKATIRTARLLLRPLAWDDLDAFTALLHDPDVRRYLCDDMLLPPSTVEGFVAQSDGLDSKGLGYWVIEEPGRDPFAGIVGLTDPHDEFPLMKGGTEVLIALAPVAMGRGIGREALEGVCAEAQRLGIRRLVGGVDMPNRASHKLMTRAGFVAIGENEGPAWMNTIYERLLGDDQGAPDRLT